MDRTIQPEIQTLKNFRILPPVRMTLPNGIPLTIINAGEQEVVRIDVLFAGGAGNSRRNCKLCLRTGCCAKARKYTAATIAENWITTAHGSNCPVRRNMHISLFIR